MFINIVNVLLSEEKSVKTTINIKKENIITCGGVCELFDSF
jgi:hypothetical protein